MEFWILCLQWEANLTCHWRQTNEFDRQRRIAQDGRLAHRFDRVFRTRLVS